MPNLDVLTADDMVNILKENDREKKRRFLEAGIKKWQLILPDKSTIDSFESLYCNHSGDVSFPALLHIDEMLVDVLFKDPPLELEFRNVRQIDDAVFSKLATNLAISICYSVKLPKYRFSNANLIELKKRNLTLNKTGEIWNGNNVDTKDTATGVEVRLNNNPRIPTDTPKSVNNFNDFWAAIKNAPVELDGRGRCRSARRGSDIRFWFQDGSLNFKSEASNPKNRAESATKETAEKWHNKLNNGMTRQQIGAQYSSWFHDIYVHFNT